MILCSHGENYCVNCVQFVRIKGHETLNYIFRDVNKDVWVTSQKTMLGSVNFLNRYKILNLD